MVRSIAWASLMLCVVPLHAIAQDEGAEATVPAVPADDCARCEELAEKLGELKALLESQADQADAADTKGQRWKKVLSRLEEIHAAVLALGSEGEPSEPSPESEQLAAMSARLEVMQKRLLAVENLLTLQEGVAVASPGEVIGEQVARLESEKGDGIVWTLGVVADELGSAKQVAEQAFAGLGDITVRDGQRLVPNLYGNAQESGMARSDLYRSVQGKVVIRNYTGQDQTVYINGTKWRARKNASHVFVPLGYVSFRKPWDAEYEVRRDWDFSGEEPQMEYELTTK